MIREYFLGGNTSKGFFSYYDYLADSENFNKIFIIKGGPGTGKSTTMKEVGSWGEKKGFDVDYIHCSSDPNSLDGVIIKDIGVAMVDGTAPHIVDPRNVGVVESIVNMGDFWDESKLKEKKDEIISLNKQISKYFNQAYNYLEAAGKLMPGNRISPDKEGAMEIADHIVSGIPKSKLNKIGSVRKLFSEAITPEGLVSYASGFNYKNKFVLKSEVSAGASVVQDEIYKKIIDKGYDVELFYSPFDPENEIRHIIVPEAELCILTSDFMSFIDENNAEIIDVDEYMEQKTFGADFLKSKLLIITLFQRAVKKISMAKHLHDELEKCYIPCINFDEMKKKREKILNELEKIAR